ncbi:MAG: amidohydrolase [Ancalomicrobiaceae bacterium]|nr:amidohydrolase [Ancalomicrobiaceae bacterium]
MQELSERDVVELIDWRRELHRHPELSGAEAATATAVADMLAATAPERILDHLGGTGVAAVYAGAAPGPTVLLRAELDALPIEELGNRPYGSTVPGRAHLCGHDGHMATLAAVARLLGRRRPARGRVILLFQPAEETGTGAAAVIADPRFAEIRPDLAFAYHNLPGLAVGTAVLGEGLVNCASAGMHISFLGRTAHAASPEDGISPMGALSSLMPMLTGLGGGDITDPDFARVTVTHARLGEPSFGIAPGEAELFVTLRALTNERMRGIRWIAEEFVRVTAEEHGLETVIAYHDEFDACDNAPAAVGYLHRALEAQGFAIDASLLPFRFSEDFGRFGAIAASAMVFLGAGTDRPALHNPDYDFPDDLIAPAARLFWRLIEEVVG